MEPVTLLQSYEFERRLASGGTPGPHAHHLAAFRRERQAARRERLAGWLRALASWRRPTAAPQPCGC
jgi:hypothetical protein